ncbi:MAG: hypothetical protein Q7J85_14365 [Bacillota bacterium]|nr:hypothetical protein [Bacillota bacterium]
MRLHKAASLVKADMRNAPRDPIIIMVLATPFLVTALLHYGLPWAAPLLKEFLGFALEEHHVFIISFFPIITPIIMGAMAGLVLLEEREGGLLAYLSVTPVTRTGYLLIRLVVPTALSFLFGLLLLPLVSPVSLPLFPLSLVLAMSSILTPITALFLGAFATNRVEGIALSKGVNVIMLAPPWGCTCWSFPGACLPVFSRPTGPLRLSLPWLIITVTAFTWLPGWQFTCSCQ